MVLINVRLLILQKFSIQFDYVCYKKNTIRLDSTTWHFFYSDIFFSKSRPPWDKPFRQGEIMSTSSVVCWKMGVEGYWSKDGGFHWVICFLQKKCLSWDYSNVSKVALKLQLSNSIQLARKVWWKRSTLAWMRWHWHNIRFGSYGFRSLFRYYKTCVA